MKAQSIPGAELEAPDTFQSLAAPYWPRLPLALGYIGGARWVSLRMSGDKVWYSDGANSGTGDTSLFLAYRRHPKVAPFLAGAHLGSEEEEAREWLVADTLQLVLYLAPRAVARQHLCAQWPSYAGPPVELAPEELARLSAALERASHPPDLHERVREALREARAHYRLMMAWLDQRSEGKSNL